MEKRIFLLTSLLCLLILVNSVYAVPAYVNVGTATNDSSPSVWETFQFDVTQYINGSSNASLYFDLRNDWPPSQWNPDPTTAQVLFGADPMFIGDYFAHFDYFSGSDTNHYKNVWLNIDGTKYVDQWGPYNDPYAVPWIDQAGTSYTNPNERVNLKGEEDYNATTYWLTKLIEVTTDKSYISDTITLGNEVSFDYWVKMGITPPQYQQGYMFDVMALQGGDGWQFIDQITAYQTTNDWQTVNFVVPENLRGSTTQLRFVATDYYPETDPTIYLRSIASNGTAPVPEPPTMLLIGSGLLGLAGFRKKLKK